MRITRIETLGFRNAMLGMRFPKNSDGKSDSSAAGIGPADLSLLLRLTKAGRDHRKALRMIHVQAAVEMPMSWWIQYDTYKVATVANSRSRMHKMGSRLLTEKDFFVAEWNRRMINTLFYLNGLIKVWQSGRDRVVWQQILDALPMSYQQERMLDLNYETLVAILSSRYSEKLFIEWRFFCDAFLGSCPHLREIWEASKG